MTITGQNQTPERARPVWEKAFLYSLCRLGNVTDACKKAKVARSVAYEHKNNDMMFADLWKEALDEAADRLEAEARRRAEKGVTKPVYQGGVLVGYIQEYSDSLMALLLKAHKPEKYRERTDITSGGEKVPIAVVKMDISEL